MRVAYLHGFLGDPAVWDGIRGPAALALTLPGHGPAGGPVAPTWEANLAAMAEAIARRGGCDVVVGYSLGARVALGLVATGRAPRAVLVSVNPGISDAERAARRASDAAWATRLRTDPLADVLDAWEAQPLFATQARASMAQRAARRARRLTLDPAQLVRSLEVMGLAEMPDYRPTVDAARITLLAGADDAKYIALARALPLPLVVVPGAGHDPTFEAPAALAEVLAAALAP